MHVHVHTCRLPCETLHSHSHSHYIYTVGFVPNAWSTLWDYLHLFQCRTRYMHCTALRFTDTCTVQHCGSLIHALYNTAVHYTCFVQHCGSLYMFCTPLALWLLMYCSDNSCNTYVLSISTRLHVLTSVAIIGLSLDGTSDS